jgi:7-keto-8-aminopelargonate synthetase-like enzyme
MAKEPTEFVTATNTYHSLGVIGHGGAGTVHHVKDDTGQEFALKYLKATMRAL